jgi:alpha-beta hydrolase superfamily lysophospholipase
MGCIDPSTALERAMRTAVEKTFLTHDGSELFYRFWPALGGHSKGAIVLFHRGHEHSGRMAHLADELELPDYAVFAWDARGHGRSPGERGYSPSLATSVRDVEDFVSHIEKHHGVAPENMAVVAQSVGAVIVSIWAHDYAPRIRCMVLASPAFKVKLYIPFARAALKAKLAWKGLFFVNSYVKPQFLTHDPARIASFKSDPLISRAIAVNILLALYKDSDRIVEDARAITIPTQLLVSGADWVVHIPPQYRFYERLGTPIKEAHLLDGFYHDTLGEKDRLSAIAKARQFIEERFAEPVTRPSLLDAHRMSYTRDESDRLMSPLPRFSLKGLYWAAVRQSLALGRHLSKGIDIGVQTGFDSGSTLDYIYRNEPQGKGRLGRLIDRSYLDAVGWKGIRQRKLHVEELLRRAMAELHARQEPVRIIDIAAGHGRYVLDALKATDAKPDSVLLRDYSETNVRAGSELIASYGLSGIAKFEKGDAFDGGRLATIEPRPTIGVISGIYELFSDNAAVLRSLKGLSAAISPGGYLIYTNQPWHPQLEFIARALTSHRQGQAWVMRRRTQAEMDQLVMEAGFRKIDQRIDEWGIFTVSLAQKV